MKAEQTVWWSGVVFKTTPDVLLELEMAKFQYEGDIDVAIQRVNWDGQTSIEEFVNDARLTLFNSEWEGNLQKGYRMIGDKRVCDARIQPMRSGERSIYIQMMIFAFEKDMFTLTASCEDPKMVERANALCEQIIASMEADTPDQPLEEAPEPAIKLDPVSAAKLVDLFEHPPHPTQALIDLLHEDTKDEGTKDNGDK